MCSLDPKGLRGCPRFAVSIQVGFVQTTDETGMSELRSSTFSPRHWFRRLDTNTRTKGSSCARDALAEGFPMTEFLRARRDLTLIGVSMDKDIGGGKMVRLIPITERTARSPSPRLETNDENASENCGVVGRSWVRATNCRPKYSHNQLEIRFHCIFIFLIATTHP